MRLKSRHLLGTRCCRRRAEKEAWEQGKRCRQRARKEAEIDYLDVISFFLLEAMICGEVHTNITGTSTQYFTICRASAEQMKSIEEVRERDINPAIRTMHAWIRFFETVQWCI